MNSLFLNVIYSCKLRLQEEQGFKELMAMYSTQDLACIAT